MNILKLWVLSQMGPAEVQEKWILTSILLELSSGIYSKTKWNKILNFHKVSGNRKIFLLFLLLQSYSALSWGFKALELAVWGWKESVLAGLCVTHLSLQCLWCESWLLKQCSFLLKPLLLYCGGCLLSERGILFMMYRHKVTEHLQK